MQAVESVNVPIEYEVAAEPVLQVGDRVRDRLSNQVGVIVKIAPSGFMRVNWLVWMCGGWHPTRQFNLCSPQEVDALA